MDKLHIAAAIVIFFFFMSVQCPRESFTGGRVVVPPQLAKASAEEKKRFFELVATSAADLTDFGRQKCQELMSAKQQLERDYAPYSAFVLREIGNVMKKNRESAKLLQLFQTSEQVCPGQPAPAYRGTKSLV